MAEKNTSEKMAHLASEILHKKDAPEFEKSLAGSVLSLAEKGREPSPEMTHAAAEIMSHSHDFSKEAVELAGSILSQSK